MHINWIGKSSELKLHCFCLFDAYSMPKDMCSEIESFVGPKSIRNNEKKNIYFECQTLGERVVCLIGPAKQCIILYIAVF